MRTWHITVGNVTQQPELISEQVKQPFPRMNMKHDGIEFSVEFDNRSDYMAARDSNVDVQCIVVSKNRGKRVRGIARNLKT